MLRALIGIILGIWVVAWPVRGDVVFGQVDDFADGTTMGWDEGSATPNPPGNVATGGPAGAGDAFLRNISSGGSGAGSKMVMFNMAQWTGDFNAAGVSRIEGQMANFGATPLQMRVAIAGGLFTNYASTSAITLPPDGVWRPVVFNLTGSGMTQLFGGNDTLVSVLGSVREMRILSAGAGPSFTGDVVAGTLGMDNLRATGLPGDADLDGLVSFADFQRLELGFGIETGATWGQGDFNFDGRVSFSDFEILRDGFAPTEQQSAAMASFAAQQSVPEPSASCLLIAASILRLVRERRRSRD